MNTLFLGLADTKYNREKYSKVSPSQTFVPLEGMTTLMKMWAMGENRPENGAYVGFRFEGTKGRVVFPEYY